MLPELWSKDCTLGKIASIISHQTKRRKHKTSLSNPPCRTSTINSNASHSNQILRRTSREKGVIPPSFQNVYEKIHTLPRPRFRLFSHLGNKRWYAATLPTPRIHKSSSTEAGSPSVHNPPGPRRIPRRDTSLPSCSGPWGSPWVIEMVGRGNCGCVREFICDVYPGWDMQS